MINFQLCGNYDDPFDYLAVFFDTKEDLGYFDLSQNRNEVREDLGTSKTGIFSVAIPLK